jgi:hypothetical protein
MAHDRESLQAQPRGRHQGRQAHRAAPIRLPLRGPNPEAKRWRWRGRLAPPARPGDCPAGQGAVRAQGRGSLMAGAGPLARRRSAQARRKALVAADGRRDDPLTHLPGRGPPRQLRPRRSAPPLVPASLGADRKTSQVTTRHGETTPSLGWSGARGAGVPCARAPEVPASPPSSSA